MCGHQWAKDGPTDGASKGDRATSADGKAGKLASPQPADTLELQLQRIYDAQSDVELIKELDRHVRGSTTHTCISAVLEKKRKFAEDKDSPVVGEDRASAQRTANNTKQARIKAVKRSEKIAAELETAEATVAKLKLEAAEADGKLVEATKSEADAAKKLAQVLERLSAPAPTAEAVDVPPPPKLVALQERLSAARKRAEHDLGQLGKVPADDDDDEPDAKKRK